MWFSDKRQVVLISGVVFSMRSWWPLQDDRALISCGQRRFYMVYPNKQKEAWVWEELKRGKYRISCFKLLSSSGEFENKSCFQSNGKVWLMCSIP